jgi:hypothetical protein
MTLREKAARIATRFEGRCTCAAMDGGVDCPWCQVFYDLLRGHPLMPPPARRAGTPGPSLASSVV